ncbi:MAG: 4Fe-4S binding protein [Nitrospinaceae bacterium]|jgi:ferredoxin/coenzyme F420-reducing hydrogenase delta subunit|nr:4Fe-4S binding protein [Nitrospinaceae bacterium]MBT3434400.1 4Fe-4S binding protein [Nitrospinaceae bacterium]MBT3822126.1 4Fe-4S binding protein [Nitrospinaceae bacterium]MBT4092586.1 4Fe-4S binding protein [Nitrospinaceae bacterium]MBT4430067.1 4Fe-4S binding protein [Nitrospinaceae bacterium]
MMIFLCRDLEHAGEGLDLSDLAAGLKRRHPKAKVRLSPLSCDHPDQWLEGIAQRDERYILGVCDSSFRDVEFYARLRKLGADPSAVEIVFLGELCTHHNQQPNATSRAGLLIEAAIAKLNALSRSRPDNEKMIVPWEEKRSRRSLFTLPPVRYEIVPSIKESLCAADEGCRVCSSECPHKALSVENGQMILSKGKCTGCGACVSLCPRGAFEFPGASLSQFEAQAGVLLGGANLPSVQHGIMFLCGALATQLHQGGEGNANFPAGWLPVEVPCLGMVTPSWILQSLSRGATAVGLLPCRADECKYGDREGLEGRVDYCRTLMKKIGLSEDSVRLFGLEELEDFVPSNGDILVASTNGTNGTSASLANIDFSPAGNGKACLKMAAQQNFSPEMVLTHTHSPNGVIEVLDGCTLCGACVNACPADALKLEPDETGISLKFSSLSCVACAGCLNVCPENIMALEKKTDFMALTQESKLLFRDTAPRCENCGEPVAPKAMLDRIGGILEDHPALSALSKYCLDCRKTMF